MQRCKELPETYLPSTGELIWLRWDNQQPKLPHSGGYNPAYVLSAVAQGSNEVVIDALPVLSRKCQRNDVLRIPYELVSKGCVLIREPIQVQCPRFYASLIEPVPEFFVEHIQYALDKMRDPSVTLSKTQI